MPRNSHSDLARSLSSARFLSSTGGGAGGNGSGLTGNGGGTPNVALTVAARSGFTDSGIPQSSIDVLGVGFDIGGGGWRVPNKTSAAARASDSLLNDERTRVPLSCNPPSHQDPSILRRIR